MSYIDKISSPHIHLETSVNKVMQQVIFALVPGIIVTTWFLGWGILVHCILAVCFALAFEAIMVTLRKRSLRVFMYDGSAIITGLLIPFIINQNPPARKARPIHSQPLPPSAPNKGPLENSESMAMPLS